MLKSVRFLLQFVWINLGTMLGFAAIVIVGAYATDVPNGAENIFRTYFNSFPLVLLIVQFIYAFALCTSNLNLALSLGATRRMFFFAIQSILLLYTGVSWALQAAMFAIPAWLGWANVDRWSILMSLGGLSSWRYLLVGLAMSCLGCLCGLIIVRSKVLGTFFVMVIMLVGCSGAMLLLVLTSTATGLWGQLPLFLALGAGAVVVVCEVVIWRRISRFVVR